MRTESESPNSTLRAVSRPTCLTSMLSEAVIQDHKDCNQTLILVNNSFLAVVTPGLLLPVADEI
jgi:hypothetical protein